MTSFRSDSTLLRRTIIRDILLYVGSFSAVVIISPLVGHEPGSTFYVFMTTMGAFRLGGLLLKDRLVQLTFDDAEGMIVIAYKPLLGHVRKREIPTAETHLEVQGYELTHGTTLPVRSVAFLKGKWEAFDIRGSKDGLTQKVLSEIVDAAQERGVHVQPS